jgi:hypothetical protein
LDGDDSDLPTGGRNKNKPDRNKKEEDNLRKQAKASSLIDKVDDMMKLKESLMTKALGEKMLMAEKKQ